ncbi:MAG: SgcJ/EcaC family oxidoreductase [Candidatus Aminicenantes bacterium]|nr:SgcJ/EcaC family oxidoreductase [Candidatus Aminicenantes bacterium]
MKFTNCSLIFVFLFCFILLCCVPPPTEEMDVEKVRMAIEEANLKFGEAVRQGDATALAALYTNDATLLPPDSDMIQGKQGIEAFWSQGLQMGVKDAVLTIVDVFGSGDLAYEIGKFTLTIQPEGQEPIEQKGKYVVVWKKTADGSWKLHVDIFNYTLPAQK